MTARVFRIGPIRVALEAGLESGAAEELLAGFPETPPGPADLWIGAARSTGAGTATAEVPSFFHGSLRAARRGGRFVVRDGSAEVVVSEDGRTLEVGGAAAGAGRALLVGLVLALRHHGLFHLHAAALRGAGARGGVLVVGPSGAGKTTLALALAASGLTSLADDAVLVRGGEGSATLVGIPRPFHLGAPTAAAFPALVSRLGPAADGGKRPLSLRALGAWAEAGATMPAPEVVLLTEIAPVERTLATATTPAAALGALLESGALVAADGIPAVREQLRALRALVDGARVARVRLGRDLLREPAAVGAALLEAVAPARRGA